MPRSESYFLDDGTEIFIENSAGTGIKRVSIGSGKVSRKLSDVLASVGPTVEQIKSTISPEGLGPDEVTVEFGVKLSTEVGVIITKASSDINFKISAKWKISTQSNGKTDT